MQMRVCLILLLIFNNFKKKIMFWGDRRALAIVYFVKIWDYKYLWIWIWI